MRNRPLESLILRHHQVGRMIKLAGLAGCTALIWPRFVAPYRWRLTRYEMPLRNLGPEFEGYRLLHLTDLHTGQTSQKYLQRVLAHTPAWRPDLIVITGDLIEYRPTSLAKLEVLLRLLRAPDGVAATFGNHDYHEYSWRHVGARSAHRSIHKQLRRLLARHHVECLCNRSLAIRRGSSCLRIVGLDELWAGRCDPKTAFDQVEAGEPCICLQHNPDGLPLLRDYSWQWMLCGHTHGGQVDLPFVGPLFVPVENRRWLRGIFEFPDSHGNVRRMFVSHGLGAGTPVRVRVPPEATLFTLRRAE